jgi:hypothetical protein
MKWLALPAVAIALAGCSANVSSSGIEKNVLTGPDFIAKAARATTSDPQAKWLLGQPGPVRESYVHDVLDQKGDRDLLSTAWLLRQEDSVRQSYINEVVQPQLR